MSVGLSSRLRPQEVHTGAHFGDQNTCSEGTSGTKMGDLALLQAFVYLQKSCSALQLYKTFCVSMCQRLMRCGPIARHVPEMLSFAGPQHFPKMAVAILPRIRCGPEDTAFSKSQPGAGVRGQSKKTLPDTRMQPVSRGCHVFTSQFEFKKASHNNVECLWLQAPPLCCPRLPTHRREPLHSLVQPSHQFMLPCPTLGFVQATAMPCLVLRFYSCCCSANGG